MDSRHGGTAGTGAATGAGVRRPAPPHEINLLRLLAQRIAGPVAPGPAAAVAWLTAMQAQDYPGVLTSVALRTASRAKDSVVAALDSGEIVKSWPMRGTLHLVAAEDLPWMLRLLAPRAVQRAAGRRARLGLDAATLEKARALTGEALAGGRRLRREELMSVWRRGGVDTAGQRGYHMLGHLAQTGTVCFGPVKDGEQLLVLVDDWIPDQRRPDREEALGELAERYFRGHGPATLKDLIRWCGLTAADARIGLTLARPRLASIEVGGVEHLLDPATPDLLAEHRSAARGVFLLPGFDELVLGYADRTATVPAEYADRIVPGGNGMFRPTVVADGLAVGTWRHTGKGAERTVAAEPFDSFSTRVARQIPAVYGKLPL